jgi:hypothetical protein
VDGEVNRTHAPDNLFNRRPLIVNGHDNG